MLIHLLLAVQLHAAPKPAEILALPETADRRLHIGQSVYQERSRPGAYTTLVTKLLAEAYAPILDRLSARANAITPSEITRDLAKVDQLYERHILGPVTNDSNFEESFHEGYRLLWFRGRVIGVTGFNRKAVRRLIRAVMMIDHYARLQTEVVTGCGDLLMEHSFTAKNVMDGTRMGSLSVLQAASQLSARPLDDEITAEDLVREILSPGDGCEASPMVRYSLALKPRVLGFYGSYFYPSRALARVDRRLEFSDELRGILKKDAEDFSRRGHKYYELGHGCPVAFATKSGERGSSLQRYVDAIRRIYDLIGDVQLGTKKSDR